MAEEIVLGGSDEWLLLAVRMAAREEGATLREVIAAGDAINHAIFTPGELRRGFAKLVAARWVERRGDRWHVSEAGRGATVRSRSEWGMDPGGEDPRWNYPLSDEEVESAIRSYHGKR